MIPSLQILINTPNQLLIRNPVAIVSWFTLIFVFIVAAFCSFAYAQMKHISRAAAAFPIWFGLGTLALMNLTLVWSHSMTLSRSEGVAVLEDRWAGITYHRQVIPLSEIDSAVTQDARGGTRVAIVLKGGGTVHPFGKGYNTKPNQYEAIEDINGFLKPAAHQKDPVDMDQEVQEQMRRLKAGQSQ